MINSLKSLYKTPYNKKHPLFAILRFFEWKMIRLFKLSNYKKKVWRNKYIFLNFDSFQSMWIMYNWIVDWEEFNLIQHFVNKDDCCVDVGANMGFYTIWFSKFCNKILSFEPNNRNYKRLDQNIKLNKLEKNISSFQMALSDNDGEVSFTNDLDGQNHILQGIDNSPNENVKCRRLDNILAEQNIDHISYLKIDVEGFELNVLRGLGKYFTDFKIDIIQIEVNDSIRNSGSSINELLQFIETSQYKLCSFNLNEKKVVLENYSTNRENYFLVNDTNKINLRLSKE